MRENAFSTTPGVVFDFLARTKPFSDLDAHSLEILAGKFEIAFYPRGSRPADPEIGALQYLFIVQKGAVKRSVARGGAAILNEVCGEGHSFGALALMKGDSVSYSIEAIEDTFCFLLKRDYFLELVSSMPKIADYYLNAFSEEIICTAYNEIRDHKIKSRSQDSFFLFNQPLRDIIRTPPEIAPLSTTIQAAAARMARLSATSLLVQDDAGELVGIITDRDLREKVVACGMDSNLDVTHAMSSPVNKVSGDQTCFDALMTMMLDQIDQVVVADQDTILGVVTSRDILVVQGSSPLFIFRELSNQNVLGALYDIAAKIPLVIRNLIEDGARATDVNKMVTVLSDTLINRIIRIIQVEIGPAPIPFCWISLGAEGRSEQLFRTSQDSALVYATTEDENPGRSVNDYFAVLGTKVVEHLVCCGYPARKMGTVASNPEFRKSYSDWSKFYENIVCEPQPTRATAATVFFDFRPVWGDFDLGNVLRSRFLYLVGHHPLFLRRLAKQLVMSKPPISFFRDVVVEKSGEKHTRLNLRSRGIMPIINFARILSLKFGVHETNSLLRLVRFKELGLISDETYKDLKEAFEFQMQLIMVNQLHQVESGALPTDFILPATLTDLDRRTLKEVFRILNELPSLLKNVLEASP